MIKTILNNESNVVSGGAFAWCKCGSGSSHVIYSESVDNLCKQYCCYVEAESNSWSVRRDYEQFDFSYGNCFQWVGQNMTDTDIRRK